jgi:exonuclease III
VRVVSWNVARRTGVLAEQAAAVGARAPDVLALQEVTPRSWPLWRAACDVLGLPHVRCSLDGADPAREPAGPRRTGVLVAARAPLHDAEPLSVPWPETALAVRAGDLAVHCVHVPNAANGWTKVRTLEALRAGLAAAPAGPRVLCGDLNTPRRENADGSVLSFARDTKGRLRPERGAAWDAAELGVVPGLRDLGYRDAFRAVHGYGVDAPSWTWRRIAGHGGGWRIDHLFASPELVPVACDYHHAWRDAELSDHAALEADLEPRPGDGDERPRSPGGSGLGRRPAAAPPTRARSARPASGTARRSARRSPATRSARAPAGAPPVPSRPRARDRPPAR